LAQVKGEEFVQMFYWRSHTAPSDRESSDVPRDDKVMHGQRSQSCI